MEKSQIKKHFFTSNSQILHEDNALNFTALSVFEFLNRKTNADKNN